MDIRWFLEMCVYARSRSAVLLVGVCMSHLALAQQPCATGIRIDGSITDPSGAVISGAQVQSASGQKTVTDESGRFVLGCLPATSATITARAAGFAEGTLRVRARLGETAQVNLQLTIASAQTDVQVNAGTADVDSDNSAGSITLTADKVQRLPDDPDDLLRQLRVLASAAGGDPSSAVVTVDGFQNSSALPPKSSIASVRINPDLFSAQYQWPPFGGGVIEIVTKPGASSLHGALFFTDSNGVFNATDPFSATATPAGKQRYGFELSGPIVRQKSGFALALEKRNIDEFNVVNATTLDADGTPAPLQQTVTAPQRLWIASARADWQATPANIATLSYSANVNSLGNQGVGGLVLTEAGYSSLASEYDLRFTNTYTPNANLLHETRIGYSWKRTGEMPNSTAPALQVAGFFTGGGATAQNRNDRERDLEVDDDLMLTHGRHTFKFGAQSLGYFIHDYDPDTFNGAYVFGGGSAPALDTRNNPTGQTITITGLEQYRRALLNLPAVATRDVCK
jgi:Carboxypeptidase regulatory-like domain